MAGITLEIDGDVDFRLSHKSCDLYVAAAGDIDETMEAVFQPRAHRACIIRSQRYGDSLKPVLVVTFKDPGHQHRGGMGVEIG
ncbi:MAG: hypothetical protein KGO48_10670 [Alphaproteobacteria bacterium]|nr:hypothetical protein [Alphaproteobacteria bacterium]